MFFELKTGRLTEPLTGRSVSPAEVQAAVGQRAGLFRAGGVGRGDVVFLHDGNTIDFFLDLLCAWRLGACVVPIDARLTLFEIETLASAAQPRLCVFRGGAEASGVAAMRRRGAAALVGAELDSDASRAPPAASRDGSFLDDPALILFTSGTTGQPKGVVHTHRSLRARWTALDQSLGRAAFARTLCLLPTHFGHGLICNSLFPWLSGQDLFILPPFRADILMQLATIIDRERITFLSSVPAVWKFVLKLCNPPQGGHLQRVFCGSAPLSAHLWREIRTWTGAPQVCNAYGITETGSWLAGSSPPDLEPADGLIGCGWGSVLAVLKSGSTDVPPREAEVCAPGEPGYVWVQTPGLMQGYLGRDDLTRAAVVDGWFLTGDIGLLDERGLLYLRGRERDEINKGGAKVYPSDVDAVAERFAGVRDVCTFAYADPLYGEEVGIALVLDQPQQLAPLERWMAQHLGAHQLPQRWYLLDEIPRTSRGKVNRADVAARCATLAAVSPRAATAKPS